MNVIDAIKQRRSIRKYKDKKIEKDVLMEVLEAGRLAPSAKNEQQWNFTVVSDPETKEKLAHACGEQMFVDEAPCMIVLWSEDHSKMACGQSRASVDISCAISFMMLRATELGLGTCWLGLFYEDQVKEILSLKKDSIVVAITPLGYPDEEPDARPRKNIEEIVHFV